MQNLQLERAYVGVELPDEAGEAAVLEVPGEKTLPNSAGSRTTKLLLVWLHYTIAFVDGSSTMSYVLIRNGGGAFEIETIFDPPSILR